MSIDASRLEAIRASLDEEKLGVEAQLRDHGASDAGEIETSDHEGFADSAQATAERSELIGLVEQLAARRAEIVAALQRLDDGTYGKCERCGREIPIDRLEALPTARQCVDCLDAARNR